MFPTKCQKENKIDIFKIREQSKRLLSFLTLAASLGIVQIILSFDNSLELPESCYIHD